MGALGAHRGLDGFLFWAEAAVSGILGAWAWLGKLGLLAAFPAGLAVTGFLNPAEARGLWTMFRSRLKRAGVDQNQTPA